MEIRPAEAAIIHVEMDEGIVGQDEGNRLKVTG